MMAVPYAKVEGSDKKPSLNKSTANTLRRENASLVKEIRSLSARKLAEGELSDIDERFFQVVRGILSKKRA